MDSKQTAHVNALSDEIPDFQFLKKHQTCSLKGLMHVPLYSQGCGVWLLVSCTLIGIGAGVSCECDDLSQIVNYLTRQLMNLDLAAQEKIRSEGDSGLKLIRLRTKGTKSYHSETFSGHSVAGMHDHSNNERTVGMGEVIAVLNGVEFRTRHNDFRLNMPSLTSGDWNAVENIPFPVVPPEVLQKPTVSEQIAEMQEFFLAWQKQDETIRDYKPYFKPVLCYLEGSWTTNTKTLDEPFFSDRHQLDANNWFDLLDKIRFTSYTGKKDNFENYAYLPTTFMNLIDGTHPELAQWNYRILCHPLKDDLPLDRLQLVDDLAQRMHYNRPLAEQLYSRAARFQLAPKLDGEFRHSAYSHGLLDDLMGEIPGKDNYGADLVDQSLDLDTVEYGNIQKLLNVAYYHRVMRYRRKGAMGESVVHRGFSDQNLFVAYNNQPQVSEMRLRRCKKRAGNEVCTEDNARLSYAIPLEIIYLTPLYEWNPYNIEHKGDYKSPEAKSVTTGTDGRRSGKLTVEEAYDGTHSKAFYRIPTEFFAGGSVDSDSADTTPKGAVGVLDREGMVRSVTGSGTRITLPSIPGIGLVRTRYSIAPVYEDGNNIKKELDALKDMVLDLQQNQYMMRDPPASFQYSAPSSIDTWLITEENNDNPYGPHIHHVSLTANDMMNLLQGERIRKATSSDNHHSHAIKLSYRNSRFRIEECDGSTNCWHQHGRLLTKIEVE